MTAARDRLFYSLPEQEEKSDISKQYDKEKLLTYVLDNVVGKEKVFSGPFGLRKGM